MQRVKRVCILLVLVSLALTGLGASYAGADGPGRGISLQTLYPDIAVSVDSKEVATVVTLTNTGKNREDVQLSATAPEGWKYRFEAGYPKKEVRAASLPPEETDDKNFKQDLTFTAVPPSNVGTGNYHFTLEARTEDNALTSSLDLTIGLLPSAEATGMARVELSADSTTLEQLAGKTFKFSVKVKNDQATDARFNFGLEEADPLNPLNGWNAYITKNYNTRIADLLIKAGATETIQLNLEPPSGVTAGEYPVKLTASAGEVSGDITLTAKIAGTYKLTLAPPKDNPKLNTKARAGKTTHVALVLTNDGSAPLDNISLSATAPDGWTVDFSPNKLDTFEPGKTREIDVSVKPGGKTIAGDYMVTFKANSNNSSDKIDFRIKVETSSAWGWIGVAVVVVVILVLFGMFIMLRRR